ncbi:hypothetical protein [Bradyrhizobium sp. SZCCHNRI3042]|uniref:hypothetical protein n=1 Tax=Bradyrhizobium sp. SZCCHNRI3042 TaxID=3057291 RepID=UPI002915C571|nr:hypothetical protein [Bradyrhizobium sp. SZCCHNRI3042]
MTRKNRGRNELQRISNAFDEDILNASPTQLRELLAEEGLDETKVVAEMDAILEQAKRSCGKAKLDQAKTAIAARGSEPSNVSAIDRERVRGKLGAMRSGAGENMEGMMMAARQGKKLSARDEEGALDDLAQLEAMENGGDSEE